MQPHMGSYPAHNVTTEIIQKYLDENKQLILAILDIQNLGKMNECAAYQARLQSNLMYLAAIADSQPQPPPVHPPQVQAAPVMPGGLHYMAHQQAQQQMAQQQALMAARNPLQYTQQSLSSMHHSAQHHQQAMAAHHGVNAGGNSSLAGVSSGWGLGGNNSIGSGGGGFPDFSRAGNAADDLQVSRGLGGEMCGNNRPDGGSGANSMHATPGGGNGGNSSGHTAEEPEASYLKASEEEGN